MGRIIMTYKTSLEELAEDGEAWIRMVEGGYVKNMTEIYDERLLRYQKLFSYLEKGYGFSTGLFKFSPSYEGRAQLDQLNQLILFNEYFDKLKLSFNFTEKPLAGYSVCPPDDAWKQLAREFNQKIIMKAKDAWENISEIKPEQKETITLMDRFNLATAQIGKEYYRQNRDLSFNSLTKEWKY